MRVRLAEQTKGNKSYMYVGVQRLSEMNANKILVSNTRAGGAGGGAF